MCAPHAHRQTRTHTHRHQIYIISCNHVQSLRSTLAWKIIHALYVRRAANRVRSHTIALHTAPSPNVCSHIGIIVSKPLLFFFAILKSKVNLFLLRSLIHMIPFRFTFIAFSRTLEPQIAQCTWASFTSCIQTTAWRMASIEYGGTFRALYLFACYYLTWSHCQCPWYLFFFWRSLLFRWRTYEEKIFDFFFFYRDGAVLVVVDVDFGSFEFASRKCKKKSIYMMKPIQRAVNWHRGQQKNVAIWGHIVEETTTRFSLLYSMRILNVDDGLDLRFAGFFTVFSFRSRHNVISRRAAHH